jgi:hypothetical protein
MCENFQILVCRGGAGDAPRGTFGKVPLGTPQNFLGQVQRVCLWKAVVKGFFLMGLRKRVSVTVVGCVASEASPVGRGISLFMV